MGSLDELLLEKTVKNTLMQPFLCDVAGATVNITPESRVGSSIYCAKSGLSCFDKIVDQFEANIIFIRTASTKIAIISLDCFLIGTAFRQAILSRCEGLILSEELLLVASHAHTAPTLDETLPRMGKMNTEYFELVASRVGDAVQSVIRGPTKKCMMRVAVGADSEQSVNRRDWRWYPSRHSPFFRRLLTLAPNLRGMRDHLIRLVEWVDKDNPARVYVALWNYSCHPVCFPLRHTAACDYPAPVRVALRERYCASIPILFVPGFMGDIRPRILDSAWSLSGLRSGRLFGMLFKDCSLVHWNRWADSIASDTVRISRQHNMEVLLDGELAVNHIKVPLSDLRKNDYDDKDLFMWHVKIGKGLQIFLFSCEPVVAYLALIQELVPEGTLVLGGGYTDGVFGYLPTSQMVIEGGYEVDGFCDNYGRKGSFKENVTNQVKEQITRLMNQGMKQD